MKLKTRLERLEARPAPENPEFLSPLEQYLRSIVDPVFKTVV
jgi:hypothetical protein